MIERARSVATSSYARVAGLAAMLALATYAYAGYAYGVWPQPGLLEYVLRLDGSLRGDWMMGLTPPHWALANLLGLVPAGRLELVVVVLWTASLLCLWASIATISLRLEVTVLGTLGAGCLLIPTSLDGVGLSQVLTPYLYPTGLAFAIVVLSIALVTLGRAGAAGLAVGIATAVHPNLGGLAMLVVLPGVAAGAAPRGLGIVRYLAGFAVAAVIPLAVLAGKLDRGDMSAKEQYDLVVRVRNPHHQLYATFPGAEYRQTLLWLAVLCVSVVVIRGNRVARQLSAITGATVLLAGLGGLASVAGSPMILVMAQTARITPLILVLGAITAAAALTTLRPDLAPMLLFVVFLLGSRLWSRDPGDVSSLEALGLLVALVAAVLLSRRRIGTAGRTLRLVTAVIAVAAAMMLVAREPTAGLVGPHGRAWRDVAAAGATESQPDDLFLVPPDQDGFRFFSHRPIVIDFGSFPFGQGIDEWRNRLVSVTGTTRVVDPNLVDTARRTALIGTAYDAALQSSPAAVCRYSVKFVVGRRSRSATPRWLVEIYENDDYALYRVRPAACA